MNSRPGVVCALLAIAAPASAQTPLRPGACAATGAASADWADFSHAGLRIALKLPPELRPLEFSALPKAFEAARRKEIPSAGPDRLELVLAWALAKKATGPVRQVLLYAARGAPAPEGRPCAMTIAGSPALVFRSAQTSADHSTDEYWIEAYWQGWVFAAVGKTAGVYEAALAILRSISVIP